MFALFRQQIKTIAFSFTVVTFFLSGGLAAQEGVSSMSINAMAAGATSGIGSAGRYGQPMPNPDSIRVEEFVNYHRHDLPLPIDDKRVRLNLRQLKVGKKETLIQVGITTPREFDSEIMPPLNLVVVIDQSGSMNTENRIGKVKKALFTLVERFRPNDRIAIVGFSTTAEVILESCHKTKKERIRKGIEKICTHDSTNLHDGLKLGYEEAMKHFDSERTNRVLFLTDGNANAGITNPSLIAKMSSEFNREGVSLSTIGVGSNFNQQLLSKLADAGKGLAHFVGDRDDIKKIFINEFESLLAPVATEVCLKIDFGMNSRDVKVFGYSPNDCSNEEHHEKDETVIELKDLNYGVTQVVLAQLPIGQSKANVKATLCFRDKETGEEVTLNAASKKASAKHKNSMKRDYAIALVADAIKRAAKQSNEHNATVASRTLAKGLRDSNEQMNGHADKNVERVTNIAQRYKKLLQRFCDHAE